MWILNQDKNKLINTDKLTCIALGTFGLNKCIKIFDGNEWHTIGIYDGASDDAQNELVRIFENFSGDYYVMSQR